MVLFDHANCFTGILATFCQLGVSITRKMKRSRNSLKLRAPLVVLSASSNTVTGCGRRHFPVSKAQPHTVDYEGERTMNTHMRNFLMAGGMLMAVAAAPVSATA